MRPERRSKVFWVDEHAIFELFVEFTKSPPEYVSIPTPINLPEGAVVDYMRHDPMRRGFAFVVSHPSFPIWEDGSECPRGDEALQFSTTRRMVREDSPGKRLVHDAMVSARRDGISYEEAMRRIAGYPSPEIGLDPGHPEGDRYCFVHRRPDGTLAESLPGPAEAADESHIIAKPASDIGDSKGFTTAFARASTFVPDFERAKNFVHVEGVTKFTRPEKNFKVNHYRQVTREEIIADPPPADEHAAMMDWFKGKT